MACGGLVGHTHLTVFFHQVSGKTVLIRLPVAGFQLIDDTDGKGAHAFGEGGFNCC